MRVDWGECMSVYVCARECVCVSRLDMTSSVHWDVLLFVHGVPARSSSPEDTCVVLCVALLGVRYMSGYFWPLWVPFSRPVRLFRALLVMLLCVCCFSVCVCFCCACVTVRVLPSLVVVCE